MGIGGRVRLRTPRRSGPERRPLFDRHSAAQRYGQPPHGACAQQHAPGHPDPLRPDEGPGRALAAGNRPCGNRDADGCRAPAGGRGKDPPRSRTRGVHRACLGLEGGIGRHDHGPVTPARRVLRLESRALHHGRGPVAGRPHGFRQALQGRPDLSRQTPGQLGSQASHGDFGPRSRTTRDQGQALVHRLSGRRGGRANDHRRDDPAGDDARRHRGRGPSR